MIDATAFIVSYAAVAAFFWYLKVTNLSFKLILFLCVAVPVGVATSSALLQSGAIGQFELILGAVLGFLSVVFLH